jgi:hypothetical protein
MMAFWVMLDDSLATDELLAGAGAATIAASLAELVTYQAASRLGQEDREEKKCGSARPLAHAPDGRCRASPDPVAQVVPCSNRTVAREGRPRVKRALRVS